MNNITYNTCYYNQPDMLKRQLENWKDFPEDWSFVIVDDCSEESPAEPIIRQAGLPHLSLYRVKEQIGFNNHGARNLAALVSPFGWLYCSDLDTMLPPEAARELSQQSLDTNHFYMFGRVQAPEMSPKNPHPNTFLMHRYQYWEAGGMDEDFVKGNASVAGCYGGDKQFTDIVNAKYPQLSLPIDVVFYGEKEFPGASVTEWPKKHGPLHKEYHERMTLKKKMGWRIPLTPVRFEWERVL